MLHAANVEKCRCCRYPRCGFLISQQSLMFFSKFQCRCVDDSKRCPLVHVWEKLDMFSLSYGRMSNHPGSPMWWWTIVYLNVSHGFTNMIITPSIFFNKLQPIRSFFWTYLLVLDNRSITCCMWSDELKWAYVLSHGGWVCLSSTLLSSQNLVDIWHWAGNGQKHYKDSGLTQECLMLSLLVQLSFSERWEVNLKNQDNVMLDQWH